MKQEPKKKKVPTFWWDWVYEGSKKFIAVESDSILYPTVCKYEVKDGGDGNSEIKEAEKYISDLNAGRIILR